jgi:hypothetical protein
LQVWAQAPTSRRAATTTAAPVAPAPEPRHAHHAHPDTRYLVASAAPDEIVRLVDGTITVRVDALQAGQRFRVMTRDAEIEASDAALDVTAQDDRLIGVRVLHGNAVLRGQSQRTLRAGETWRATVAPPIEPAPPAPVPVVTPPIVRHAPRVDDAPAPAARATIHVAFDDGWTALRAGDYPRAAAAFERAAFAGGNAGVMEDATYWGAVALARGGEIERAVKKLESFLDGYASSVRAGEASVMLGWLHFQRGDHGLAARRFEAARDDASPRIRASAELGLRAITDHRRSP